jgi:two-component system, cell cycle response regulator
MERTAETWVISDRPVSNNREACLVYIYPTGPGIGTRHFLPESPVVIGRGADCEIFVDDFSVSRRHAQVEQRADGFYAVDLQSTNGTFVNDISSAVHKLNDGDYLRVGNSIWRFLAGGNVEAEYHEEIYRLTIIDALTGCFNKRYLMEYLDRELARSARFRRPLTAVLLDIDHFKGLNDEYGHLFGDFTLRELAGLVRSVIRTEELLARYGGEEFVIVIPESELDDALALCERVRSLVECHVFRIEDKSFRITISLGVATTCGSDALTGNELIRQADEKLYEAKRAGRNQVAVALPCSLA